MGRILGIVILALVMAGVVAYNFDLIPIPKPPVKNLPPKNSPPPEGSHFVENPKLGGPLYPPQADVQEPAPRMRPTRDPILISAQLQVMDKVEISSQLEGQLLFVGEEIPLAGQLVCGLAPLLVDPFNSAKVTYQYVERDKEKGLHFVDRDEIRVYRRLMKGQTVEFDQMLALMNPNKAMTDRRLKEAKVEAAEADYKAAAATTKEANENYLRTKALFDKGTSTRYDMNVATVTYVRAREEEVAKAKAAVVAKIEMEQAQFIVKQHDIRNQLPVRKAIVKEVYHERGETIKMQDNKIMELYGLDTFLADGLVDVQYLPLLRAGMPVTIEPSHEEAPLRVLKDHRGEITCVAFTADPDFPQIVSASEDRSVLVWDIRYDRPRRLLHDEPVRVVACSPAGSGHNLVVSGCADGSMYLWDLDYPEPLRMKVPAKELAHQDVVTSLAFSPDGRFLASGGADAVIKLWNIEPLFKALTIKIIDANLARAGEDPKRWDAMQPILSKFVERLGRLCTVEQMGPLNEALTQKNQTAAQAALAKLSPDVNSERRYTIEGHQGAVTSLHFTPQCKLVSASRDNTVRVWYLHENGAESAVTIGGRAGSVAQLGVSGDGRYMLFDQGKMLQFLSVADGRTLNYLQNPAGTSVFDTLAAFSPDATQLLTAGAAEGRLLLWSTPTEDDRGYEVRQLVTKERAPVTCAAFASGTLPPNKQGLAASGTKDGFVYVWNLPSAYEVKNHRIHHLKLTTVNAALDATVRQVRVSVEVRNEFSQQYPNGRLIPGRPVTIVIEP